MNRENPGVDNVKVFSGLANPKKPNSAKKTGTTAIATGTKGVCETGRFLPEYTAAFPILAMHWGLV